MLPAMKISSNPTRQGIRMRWHVMRLGAVSAILAAFWFPNNAAALVGIGLMVLVAAYASKLDAEDLLVEVFDDGDKLRFVLGDVTASANMAAIAKVEFEDGGDGMDQVTITLAQTTPFGKVIRLVPEPVYVFEWNVKVWFADLQRRVQNAKTSASVYGA